MADKTSEHQQFVESLRTAMKRARYSGRELAKEVGVDPSYVTRILSGSRNPPSAEVIEDIARTLDLNTDRLLMEAGKLPTFLRSRAPLTDEDLNALKEAYNKTLQGRIKKSQNSKAKP